MRISNYFLIVVLLVLITPLHAQQDTAASLYEKALQNMRAEKYTEAVQLFDQARQAGMENTNLHYNRGVALYKLKRYEEAKKAFLLAEKRTKNRPLVHYNLGLATYRLNKQKEAQRWFEKVSKAAGEQQLGRMANRMLAKMGGMKPARQMEKRWRVIADAALGYDDNVTLRNTELAQGSSQQDLYLDFYGSFRYQLTGERRNGLSGQISLAAIKYRDLGDYDTTQYDASLYQDNQFANWRTRIGLKYTRANFGGNDYLQKGALQLQTAYHLNKRQRLRARYEITRYDELDKQYDYLAGLRQKIRFDGLWKIDSKRLSLGYDLELNDRDDRQVGNDFTSYSATRHKIKAALTFPVMERLRGKLGAEYRRSTYNDANVVGGVTDVTREDDRTRLSAEIIYKIDRNISAMAKYRYTDNDSNISSSSYQRSQILIGVQSLF